MLAEEGGLFNLITSAIDGLPTSTLSSRLKALQREDAVVRDVDGTASPPAVTYSLTEKGDELAAIIVQIEELEARYS